MIETLRKLLMGLAMGGMLGCPSPKPTPTPTPSPTPTPGSPGQPVFLDLLVAPGPNGTLTRTTQPFNIFGFIPCWDPEEKDHMGWPAISDEGMDYALSKGANTFYIRMGPFNTDPNAGMNLFNQGPYINNDPSQGWNTLFWEHIHHVVRRAASKNASVQIDIIDGWGCKHASYGDFKMPWPSADVEACTNHMTPLQEEWIRKIVAELGCYGNVFWQDGNEVGVSGRYQPQWSLDLYNIVRDEEQKSGCGIRHMIGTNSGREEVECNSQYDYSITHNSAGIGGPHCDKHRMNNEHNPDPLFTPEQEHQLYCSAKLSGQTWMFWRGGQTQENMDKILNLWQGGCDGMGTGDCPFTVPNVSWIKVKPHGSCGNDCDLYDATPLINDRSYCKSIGFPGQANCPVRQEGDPFRLPCEIQAMGGQIEWNVAENTGDIKIQVRSNGFKIFVTGHGRAKIQCFSPNQPGMDMCFDSTGQPLYIER